ncbi:uncharacterized protein [Spinacia oleracea]|uniref:Retrotransposon gag domain-containing protein n=1 Tax=Spinacia oleracea TaxID=3562 RepID=A0ABM3RRF0_SPIOL|nr:uncharacterized protein LOC130471881 [Spinacia oleracea]
MINKIPGVPTPIKEASLDSYVDSPYADPIDAIDIPKWFIPPNMPMYDGTTNPREHILTYKQRMMTIPVPKYMREASLCKGFGSTLIGPSLKWLTSLPNGCITSFAHLDNMFNQQFASSRCLEKQTSDLYRVAQRPDEPLKDYIARFIKEKVTVPECDVPTGIEAFRQGLYGETDLWTDLIKYPYKTFEDAQAKATAQVRLDEPPLKDGESGAVAPKSSKPESKKDPSKWCDFHADIGHTTNECVALRREVAYLNKNGYLKDVMSDKARGVVNKDNSNSPSRPPPPPPHTKTVNFIARGSDVCGLTYSAAKRHARENEIDRPTRVVATKYLTPITFDESDAGDISDKHHDGLVISIPFGNCMIKRVLVDNDSSTNVMMLDALKEMVLNPDIDVVKKSTVLIGFSGEAKTTFGEVSLTVYAQGVNQQALDSRHEGHPIDIPSNHQIPNSEIKGDHQESKESYKAALKPSATNKSSL